MRSWNETRDMAPRSRLLLRSGILLASVGAAFFLGYGFGKDYLEAPDWAKNLRERARAGFARGGDETQIQAEIQTGRMDLESTFIRLKGQWVEIPVSREGSGGGLTSFGEDAVLLTHEGRIFAGRSAPEIQETAIQVPDNGFEALEAAARSDRFDDLLFHLGKIRYNDILHFRTARRHGLAVSFTNWDDRNECYSTAVAILDLDLATSSIMEVSARPEDWKVVFRTEPCLPLKRQWRAIEGHMAGGRLAFAPPSTILLASGDYHWDGLYAPAALAQKPDNHYGKVVAISLESGRARTISAIETPRASPSTRRVGSGWWNTGREAETSSIGSARARTTDGRTQSSEPTTAGSRCPSSNRHTGGTTGSRLRSTPGSHRWPRRT
jgi:hypothetical protein